ncbi:hypothetical protein BATDEDRAFT_36218 [Batrachochytrium dendrobatidis JAM81]|uniref:Phosphodiesterase n=1 Tax=Batrachochytrium dendrobatidis (strain JAM81 / FGSC 10211) TaxID=684364 RepID=F4PDL8_BATDJ|nr:uncharacterized protein BATDEDRAFT_36218 [Batrachochytrium dendrobatidis JAM81]EGF76804.1 hypothetical protein BATDEDRAFT_36218 [Batrachochytrium dendrobatidis JAM81]|eukprot:XP_006682662.1 hypothetical protein BATDEDRAFT_36218 [Batrachochytrium dendrobatidis JAM81]
MSAGGAIGLEPNRVYMTVDGRNDVLCALISSYYSVREVHDTVRTVANIPATPKVVVKLYTDAGVLLPIGPHLRPNSAIHPYRLVSSSVRDLGIPKPSETAQNLLESVKVVQTISDDVDDMKDNIAAVKFKVEQIERYSDLHTKEKSLAKPATRRVARVLQSMQLPIKLTTSTISKEVYEQMKLPTFDIWIFKEEELIDLMAHMFTEFGLISTFQINEQQLFTFLNVIKNTYNHNPFHNFQHCFCVTQMMYALLHVTSVHKKFTQIEKLSLIVAAIGHDLDHPGFNNAYQVNACTELATTYNDSSPLENHHAGYNVSASDYKEARKIIIQCILATDMAKHGEILSKFKGYAENFSYDDGNHRQALFQMLMKCSDISNEVRPKHISEPWVDNLLEEFFAQSDKEKLEGLPTAPFMDRDKVTKPSAQVGFIGFVMIPLFELASKVLPNMEEPIIHPIRKALEFYKNSLKPNN